MNLIESSSWSDQSRYHVREAYYPMLLRNRECQHFQPWMCWKAALEDELGARRRRDRHRWRQKFPSLTARQVYQRAKTIEGFRSFRIFKEVGRLVRRWQRSDTGLPVAEEKASQRGCGRRLVCEEGSVFLFCWFPREARPNLTKATVSVVNGRCGCLLRQAPMTPRFIWHARQNQAFFSGHTCRINSHSVVNWYLLRFQSRALQTALIVHNCRVDENNMEKNLIVTPRKYPPYSFAPHSKNNNSVFSWSSNLYTFVAFSAYIYCLQTNALAVQSVSVDSRNYTLQITMYDKLASKSSLSPID